MDLFQYLCFYSNQHPSFLILVLSFLSAVNFLTHRQYDPGGKILFPLGLSFSIWKTKIRLAQWFTIIHFDDISLLDAVHPSTHLGVPRCNTAQGNTTICQFLCDGESVLCWLWIKYDASCSNLFSPPFHCTDD